MGTLNALYVKEQCDGPLSAIRAQFSPKKVEVGNEYIGFIMSNDYFNAPERDLTNLSIRFATDVLWLTFQSVSDSFAFHHWQAGKHLRSLVYGCNEESTWERVEGVAELWEQNALFRDRDLQTNLRNSTTAEDRAEVSRICLASVGIGESGHRR